MIKSAKDGGINRSGYMEAAKSAMAGRLSKVFDVSESAAKVMIERQKLDNKIP